MTTTDQAPRHWFWHPLIRFLVWPVLARLGFVWFLTVDGEFYLFRHRTVPYQQPLVLVSREDYEDAGLKWPER